MLRAVNGVRKMKKKKKNEEKYALCTDQIEIIELSIAMQSEWKLIGKRTKYMFHI